jgi:PiT family inorganic phosphate transporter
MAKGKTANKGPKDKFKKDLKQLTRIDKATQKVTQGYAPVGISILFLIIVFYAVSMTTGGLNNSTVMIIAAVLGGYMALNIGANDVANNVSPAVGSKAITMGGALVLAAIFESAGAFIAGGDVVKTISKGIINQDLIADSTIFIMLMMSALLAAALWLNLATYLGAPVSTTHSIVGGVMGGGIAAAGFVVVNWGIMSKIAASWVISPVLGGVIAAILFKIIKSNVLSKKDMISASKRWVPILVSIMASAFTMYLMVKGFKKIWKPEKETIWLTGAIVLFILPMILRPLVSKQANKLENRAKSVNKLFSIPLIVSAALLSFAHGSNDVANAIGPLAAIVGVAAEGSISAKVGIPLWVMVIGAFGISFGLILFGPKIIKTVGEKITKIDQVRAFCVVLSAAITVITASTFGLPVSTTHITVGAVFGIGLYRELSSHRRRKKAQEISEEALSKRKLVRRKYLYSIAAAWVITVPCAALLSGGIYWTLTNFDFAAMID